MSTQTLRLLGVTVIAFVAVYLIAYLMPMQSDDYAYANTGLGLQSHWQHYLIWSGRVVSDYISSLMLVLLNKPVIAALTALATILLMLTITYIPRIVAPAATAHKNQTSALVVAFMLMLFWVGNPALGETVFWVVGSANYLYTTLFVSLYIACLLSYICHGRYYAGLLLFSFLAGLSNENTAFIVVFIALCSSVYSLQRSRSKAILVSCGLVLLGAAILYLCPGSFNRANQPFYAEWNDMTLFGKMSYFLSEKLFWAFRELAVVFLTAVLLLVVNYKYHPSRNALATQGAVLFLLAAFLSLGIMILSPTFPRRALMGPMFFMLISVSFSVNSIWQARADVRMRRFMYVLLLPLSLGVIVSYSLMLRSTIQVHKQEQIRQALIQAHLNAGDQVFAIPGFYWPRSLRGGDSPDTSMQEYTISQYYGVKRIITIESQADFAK
ncbi:DUF6056 family protein [Brackiella oedipodis]|uniref:DUF6056 family protein n=1 Tax=Brackiella oedipodis TaxID=124225 RepID=UPI00048BE5BA|nr:DUF6056 family protein [Brackiella oedipodis]